MTNAMRKLELRERIQAAAKTVFLEKGYAETKINDIAKAADISPSTIYLYFSGKKDLLFLSEYPAGGGHPPGVRAQAGGDLPHRPAYFRAGGL